MDTNKIILKKQYFNFRWEYVLILFFILINIINASISPYYLVTENLLKMSQVFIEKGIIGLILLLLVISGNVDISPAAILALSAAMFGFLYDKGLNILVCIMISLIIGTFCGFLNGIIIIKTGLPSIIVTLVNLTFFRGFAYVLLKDEAIYGFPDKFTLLGNGTIPNTAIPIADIIFIVLAIIVGLILHKTYIGRYLYAIGSNRDTASLSGINVKKITLSLFTISGFIYAFSAILLASRLGSIRPNIATGFELEVITIIVFGGAAVFGGNGTIFGFILSLLTLGYLRFGLALINIPGQVMIMISGLLLIIAILSNNLIKMINEKRILKVKL